MAERVIVVISDLHVGAPPLDDCEADLEQHLADFIRTMGARDEAVELVINGASSLQGWNEDIYPYVPEAFPEWGRARENQ